MNPVLGFMNLGAWEIAMLAVIGVLLFGRKLPEVGRSLGKGIVEFKKGLKGLEDEVESGASAALRQEPTVEAPRPPQRVVSNVPKFQDQATDSEGKPRYS